MEQKISELRAKIDQIDEQIFRSICERYDLAEQIARIKDQKGLPIYSPEREAEILQMVQGFQSSPLSQQSLCRIFQVLIEETRNTLQKRHPRST